MQIQSSLCTVAVDYKCDIFKISLYMLSCVYRGVPGKCPGHYRSLLKIIRWVLACICLQNSTRGYRKLFCTWLLDFLHPALISRSAERHCGLTVQHKVTLHHRYDYWYTGLGKIMKRKE